MSMHPKSMQSTLGKVRGLGASHTGAHHFIAQRLSAIALVPLCLWMVYAVLSLKGADHTTLVAWLNVHGNLVMTVLFLGAAFYHAQLGLQVVVEDYVHGEVNKLVGLILIKFAAIGLAVSSILAVLSVAFGG